MVVRYLVTLKFNFLKILTEYFVRQSILVHPTELIDFVHRYGMPKSSLTSPLRGLNCGHRLDNVQN